MCLTSSGLTVFFLFVFFFLYTWFLLQFLR